MSKMIKDWHDAEIAKLLDNGGVGVIPSDTVYGLMTKATNQAAVMKLYSIKDRNHPGTIIAGSKRQLIDLGLKARYLTAVEAYWPWPISVIIPCGPELQYLHLGKNSLAVRVVDQPHLVAITEVTGPLLTTSANMSGEPVATTIDQAQKVFESTIDFYVDGGEIKEHQPSTVIRIIDDAIEIVRLGAVNINEYGEILE